MGLDVYFRKIDDFQKMKDLEAAHEAFCEDQWGGNYNGLSDADKEVIRGRIKANALELGLKENGEYPGKTLLPETPSTKYPDHMFNLGYWRSSYNSGGINSVAENNGLPSLYDIMMPPDGEYYFKPDWNACLERAEKAVAAWRAAEALPESLYGVIEEQMNQFVGMSDLGRPIDSARITHEKIVSETSFAHGFSCREGSFYPEGIDVIGIRLGETMSWNKQMVPTVHLVYRRKDGKSPLAWYRESIEIVHETLVHMMQHPDRDQIYVAWSG